MTTFREPDVFGGNPDAFGAIDPRVIEDLRNIDDDVRRKWRDGLLANGALLGVEAEVVEKVLNIDPKVLAAVSTIMNMDWREQGVVITAIVNQRCNESEWGLTRPSPGSRIDPSMFGNYGDLIEAAEYLTHWLGYMEDVDHYVHPKGFPGDERRDAFDADDVPTLLGHCATVREAIFPSGWSWEYGAVAEYLDGLLSSVRMAFFYMNVGTLTGGEA